MKTIKCWKLNVSDVDGGPHAFRFTTEDAACEARKKCLCSNAARIRLEEIDLFETAAEAEWTPPQSLMASVLAKMTDEEKKTLRLEYR